MYNIAMHFIHSVSLLLVSQYTICLIVSILPRWWYILSLVNAAVSGETAPRYGCVYETSTFYINVELSDCLIVKIRLGHVMLF